VPVEAVLAGPGRKLDSISCSNPRPHWEDADVMADLPTGTVTFLFTDVDGSTELVKRLGEHYAATLAEHRDLLRAAFAKHAGPEVDTQGDAFFVAFVRARAAVAAAIAAQRALADHPWAQEAPVSVRMGLHTGEAYLGHDGYTGVAVHRAARICTISHGGQVLLSRSTAGIVDDEKIPGVTLRDLGEHRLKDIDGPERVFQLVIEGLRSDFPPLRTVDRTLTGTVTIVLAEGRRMMRLSGELTPERFGALITEYQRLLSELFEAMGGREMEVVADSALAAFPTAKEAALAAVAAQRAVAAHEWPYGLRPAMSVGLHSGQAGIGWVGPAVMRCSDLCDVAEGGQILLSQATAGLLEDEDLGELLLRDLGEQRTRRSQRAVHAYELVVPSVAETT
jgi:class 3 adenylate cyclase